MYRSYVNCKTLSIPYIFRIVDKTSETHLFVYLITFSSSISIIFEPRETNKIIKKDLN